MSIDALFLDIGGVVFEINWRRTAEALGFLSAPKQDQMWSKVAHWDLHLEFERGKVTPEHFFTQMRSELSLEKEHDLIEAWNKLIVGPLPQAETIFDKYKNKLPILALSNTNKTHYDHLIEKFSISKKFNHFLTSFDLGHRKPDPEIYLAAAEFANVKPERSLFIDDNLSNVECAKKLGFKSYQTVNSVEKTLIILRENLGF